jgi:hypothetical protein
MTGIVVNGSVWGHCIHGVPYSGNFSCAQCGAVRAATNAPSAPMPLSNLTSADKDELLRLLRRTVELLERIAGAQVR